VRDAGPIGLRRPPYRIARDGRLSLLDPSGVTVTTGDGPADLADSADGSEIFVRNGGDGTISAFHANDDGSLVAVGSVGGLPAGSTALAAR
jgi:DNA-binding beta-propeller fold protein YncE